MNELEQMAQNLDADPDYRVLRRLNVPDAYSTPDGVKIHLGLFADTETTGLEVETVGIIEIALLPFEFSSDGRIFRVRKDDALSELNDPGIPIPPSKQLALRELLKTVFCNGQSFFRPRFLGFVPKPIFWQLYT